MCINEQQKVTFVMKVGEFINLPLLKTTLCLFKEDGFIIPCVDNLTEEKSCMFNDISHIVFLVTSTSMFNNYIPTFTKPEAFTFVNNIVINCLLMKKLMTGK
jgi:hypothetical protein